MSEETDQIARQLQRALGLPRGSLPQTLRRARRVLPRPLRRDAALILEADTLSGNPRLSRRLDHAQVAAAETRLEQWAKGPDAQRIRIQRWSGRLASFIVSLAVAVLLFMLLRAAV